MSQYANTRGAIFFATVNLNQRYKETLFQAGKVKQTPKNQFYLIEVEQIKKYLLKCQTMI